MRRVRFRAAAMIGCALLFGGVGRAEDRASDDGWHLQLTFRLWATSAQGSQQVKDLTFDAG